MEKKLKIYMVRYIESDSIDEVLAYFDSKEKAEAFLNRFKTTSEELEIAEIPLNPEYIVNKQGDPYLVSFKGKSGIVPVNSDICDYIEQAEWAQKEQCSISFLDDDDLDDGYFEIMLFAASKEEAIANGIKKREELIASGEWAKVYQEILRKK